MKILFIAPIPPPITGHSLVSKILLNELVKTHIVDIVDLSKDSLSEGVDGFKRIIQIITIFKKIAFRKKGNDIIYFTISESLAGNLKDLIIYFICFRSIDKIYIHLHGGSIKKQLWNRYNLIKRANHFFIKRIRGVIISGESHISIFSDMITNNKIHIIPNFAQDYLFVDSKIIKLKYESPIIRVLYMSNLIPKKGYNDLADAFQLLNDEYKQKIQIDFAGAFDSEQDKTFFLNKISKHKQIKYHGIVNDEAKRLLFSKANVFCLPTSYFEGQPISILEAYASGCVVVTTPQSGILDIFEPEVNGFLIEPESPESIKHALESLFNLRDKMYIISNNNLSIAFQKYRTSIYCEAIKKILEH